MARTTSGVSEPDGPERPDPEVAIRVTVPPEFVGAVMGELNRRRGRIEGMDGVYDVTVRALLPASEVAPLAEAVNAMVGKRVRIERE